MYNDGKGVPRSYAEAVNWFCKAAEQGDASAQNFLGSMYNLGRGVSRDDAEAVNWFRKAAAQGDASAEESLGTMYKASVPCIKPRYHV
jgi:TPR repeat protein